MPGLRICVGRRMGGSSSAGVLPQAVGSTGHVSATMPLPRCCPPSCLPACLLQEIGLIAPVHTLGALSLDSQPLKFSLRAEAANWKVHFSKTIHKRAAAGLMVRVGGQAMVKGGGRREAGGGRREAGGGRREAGGGREVRQGSAAAFWATS